MYCKADVLFGMLNTSNRFTTNPGYWNICVVYILPKRASPQGRDEIEMNLMLINMKNNICRLISNIIVPEVLALYYPVHIETLVMNY